MQKVEILVGRLKGKIMIASCVKPSYGSAHSAQRDFTQGVKDTPGANPLLQQVCSDFITQGDFTRHTLHLFTSTVK